MEAFERVQAARSKGRPTGTDFINHIFDDFIEMHGDRRFGDDKAIVAGIARLNGMPVTVIALERGHDTKENYTGILAPPIPRDTGRPFVR